MPVTNIKRKHGKKKGLKKGQNVWTNKLPRYSDGTIMSVDTALKFIEKGVIDLKKYPYLKKFTKGL